MTTILPQCSIATQNHFGPVNNDCHDGFDFTLLFEETILTIGPLSLVLLVLPFRLYALSKTNPKAKLGWLHTLKLVSLLSSTNNTVLLSPYKGTFFVYTALQFLLLGILVSSQIPKTRATIVCHGLTTFLALSLCLLSHLEHSRTVRPSWTLNVYLLLSLAFDIVRARTLWAIPQNKSLAIVFVIAVSIKGIMVCLEAKEKRKSLLPKYQYLSPEATSGIYNSWFFWWLNPLFLRGYKKALTVDQLFCVDHKLAPNDEGRSLLTEWRNCKDYKS